MSSGPGCSKYWIKLSTGQILIQYTASQWIKLVVPTCKSNPDQKKRGGLLSSAKFQVIFQAVQFICCDLQMIYDQSLCYLCDGAGNLCIHRKKFQVIW